jgi:diguanylate cyclase (GGDEF)-like protein
VAMAGLLAGGIIMVIALLDVTPLVYTKVVELIIASIYVSVFARFWPMVLLSVGLALMHAVVITHTVDVLGTVALGSSLLMGTTLLFTLVASYRMERNERLSFLLDQREKALGVALQDANKRLHDLARTDALTGVANRRYFDAFLAQSWRVAQDTGKSLGLLLIDVDHFKVYNDLYGHQAGDRCLCAVTDAIGQCLRRPVDLLARWGGEEFAVVIADTDGASLDHVAERIRQSVQGLGLVHAASSCAPVVTVSIGMASMVPASGADLKDLMNATDAALYQAKANGRNQVCARSQELVT